MHKETVQLHLFLHNLEKRAIQSTKLSTRSSENQTHVGSDGYTFLLACRQNLNCEHACMLVATVLCVLNEEYHQLISLTSSVTHFGNHCCFSSQSSCHDALIRSLTTEAHQEFIAMYGFTRFWEPRNEAAKEQRKTVMQNNSAWFYRR